MLLASAIICLFLCWDFWAMFWGFSAAHKRPFFWWQKWRPHCTKKRKVFYIYSSEIYVISSKQEEKSHIQRALEKNVYILNSKDFTTTCAAQQRENEGSYPHFWPMKYCWFSIIYCFYKQYYCTLTHTLLFSAFKGRHHLVVVKVVKHRLDLPFAANRIVAPTTNSINQFWFLSAILYFL